MGNWLKIIRDPVHNIIYFEDNEVDRLLLKLVHTKEFQRLRRIKQLGPAEMVFPGANHSRFSHSLGVMHMAKVILRRMEKLGEPFDVQTKTIVLVSALLHDVGHGPFSHTFEAATKEISKLDHEDYTQTIVRDTSTEVHQVLLERDPALPYQVSGFFDKDPLEALGMAADIPPYLAYIVHSQLDGDRFDYLLRDSHHAGVDYGKFDLHWLLENMFYCDQKKVIYLGRKALSVAENYIFARYHMYKSVYFHKASRSAEVMLHLLLHRYRALIKEAQTLEEREKIVAGTPTHVLEALTKVMPLENYLALDDYTLTEFFKACQYAADPTLKLLGDGLINRRLFKCFDATDKEPRNIFKFKDYLQEAVNAKGYLLESDILMDTPKDTPYKPYEFSDENPATQIFIESSGTIKEISTISEPIQRLGKKYSFFRFYYPHSMQPEVEKNAKMILG